MQYIATKTSLAWLLLIASLSFWALPASAAPKTDIVIFKNGDKLTGEFKSLNRGRLDLNTEAMGTIGMEWDKISNVISNQRIQVETSDGVRYFGRLAYSERNSRIVVETEDGAQALDVARVVLMTPIEGRGRKALDVDLSVGYNFAKAGSVTSGTLGVNMDYRSLLRIESLSFSTTITDSSTQDVSKRTNLSLQHTRLWNRRWFSNGRLTFDQNDELGLDLRTSLGAGGGRYVVRSNTMLLSLEAGLQFSRENLIAAEDDTDSEDYTDSLEATFSANWDWFYFDDPGLDWSTTLQIIPSLTENGRVRGELDTTLGWELIGDVKLAFSLYGSFDNQPQSDAGATSDYGVNTTLAYKF